jgi:antitoxin (DNA-binding transcriptional repressor) of toxin-antitoxin stability system
MEIWSNLLPEMIDINPREVLIINPIQEKIYGFNSKDNSLSGSDIEIERGSDNIFNIILKAITAGEIGKITDNGKPIYKIVGKKIKKGMMFSSLKREIEALSKYKFLENDLKKVLRHLKWTHVEKLTLDKPKLEELNKDFDDFIWIETIDDTSQRCKVYFSLFAPNEIIEVINNESLHESIFGKKLNLKNENQE